MPNLLGPKRGTRRPLDATQNPSRAGWSGAGPGR
jgi:hypothetical protein